MMKIYLNIWQAYKIGRTKDSDGRRTKKCCGPWPMPLFEHSLHAFGSTTFGLTVMAANPPVFILWVSEYKQSYRRRFIC